MDEYSHLSYEKVIGYQVNDKHVEYVRYTTCLFFFSDPEYPVPAFCGTYLKQCSSRHRVFVKVQRAVLAVF